MNTTLTLLSHLLDHPGEQFSARKLAATACSGNAAALAGAPTTLAHLLSKGVVAREGVKWCYTWSVPNTETAKAKARTYLASRTRGPGRSASTPFNRDRTPSRGDKTPPQLPADDSRGYRAVLPDEPLMFTIDQDGDLQITGRNSGIPLLFIPKHDALDLLDFARKCAPVLEER